ncbi:MAG: ATP-binding protein [Clostridium sp.]
MRLSEFLKEKIISFIIIILAIITIEIFLMPYSINTLIKIYIPISILFSYFLIVFIEYLKKKNFYNNLTKNLENLDKKYLIPEIIDKANFLEGKILINTLKEIEKSMAEHVNKYKFANEEYKEYIELWIHEIKTPIAVSKMIVENNPSEVTKNINEEIEKVEYFVEQALFYARSNNVEKDYIIKPVNLQKIINLVILKNKRSFISKKIKLNIHDVNKEVYSDSKWMIFILNQIIINSIKYSKKDKAEIEIFSEEYKDNIILYIKDNGIGIESDNLPRVFEKGFTGENGRKINKSTGIGLYLCKKLCDKLGQNIEINSVLNIEAVVKIYFPKNSFTKF